MNTFSKILPLLAFLALTTNYVNGQTPVFGKYYYQRVSLFEKLPDSKKEIIFLGNSITDGCEWSELLNNKHVKNRGISGDVTTGVLLRLSSITRSKPEKLFLLIGINDLANGVGADSVVTNIKTIVRTIHRQSPKTNIYVQSILPVNEGFTSFPRIIGKTELILKVNTSLKENSLKENYTFIDLFSKFKNADNYQMNPTYTNDGLHLMGEGYLLWADIIQPFIK